MRRSPEMSFDTHAHALCVPVSAGVGIRMRALVSIITMAAAALTACSAQDDARIEQTRARLIGTWIEEPEPGSTTARRVLSLGADGKFTYVIFATVSDPARERMELGGEWSYDGSNLKRRFLQENGRQFSGGGIRYATFPLKEVTDSEFVVEDNIRKRRARYRRIGSAGAR